jgi:dimethylaniline monooxygenase (N-oxide forming)
MAPYKRVAVIGAGPSGLTTLKYLLASQNALGSAPVDVRLFESESAIGGTFFARTYEDAEVSSKILEQNAAQIFAKSMTLTS